MVVKERVVGESEMGEECHKITTSSYKITPVNRIYFMVTIVKNDVLHI